MLSDEVLWQLYHEMHVQAGKARAASQRWEKERERVRAYMKANAGQYKTALQQREKLQNDWGAKDAMDAWSWHEREQRRLGDLIRTELAMRQLCPPRHGGV